MSTVVDLKTKEEKDAELDRRIEALRKKNEALVRRYQEIEEDKKKAEQEGIAVTTARKPRPHDAEVDRRRMEKENFTVTVDLSKPAGEKRVINDRKPATPRGGRGTEEGEGPRPQGESPPRRAGSGRLNRAMPRGGSRQDRREPRHDRAEPRPDRPLWDSEPGEGPGRTERAPRGGVGGGSGGSAPQGGMGDRKSKEWEEKRRQNIEKMNEEMEKIAEYERGQRGDGDKHPNRNFLDDPRRCGPIPDMDRKEGSRRHVRNWGGVDFDNVKTGPEMEKEWMQSRRPGSRGSMDMTLSMTGRERAEYLRWKKEREQIDEERLARHRNATGQWRREWDAQKTETMFKEEAAAVATEGTSDPGVRRDDSKRPPKAPTIGDFLGQGKPKDGGRGGRGRGRGRTQNKSYSMHDNRWEAEKEDESEKEQEKVKEKESEVKERESEVKEKKAPPSSTDKVEVVVETARSGGAAEDDEDEWEDASEGEEVEVDEEEEEVESEEEEDVAEKVAMQEKEKEKAKGKTTPTSPTASPSRPQGATDGAKEQRTPRPRVHIPSPQSAQDSPESTKPLSPFSPMEGYYPVSDWGEEMEMQSPRVTLGESPLKPNSAGAEGSPVAQKPGSPDTQKPGSPVTQKPGSPITQKPGSPDAPEPGSPDAPKPGSPVTQKPGSPVTQKPGSPDAPEPGSPGAPKPGSPVTQKPGSPDAPEPGSPITQKPGSPITQKPGSPIPVEPHCEKQTPSLPAEQGTETSEQTVVVSQSQEEPDISDSQCHDASAVMEPTEQAHHSPEVEEEPVPTGQIALTDSEVIVSQSQEEPDISESQCHDDPAVIEPTEQTHHSPEVEEEPVPTGQVALTDSEADAPVPSTDSDENQTPADTATEMEVPEQPSSG